jgi:hypothetical protein
MLSQQVILMAATVAALIGVFPLVPRCPECGFILSVRDTLDPSLRHCRRCMSIFRRERR